MATNDYDLTVEGGVRPILPEGELCAICDLVLEQEGVGRPCAVSVSIVSDERMRELNRTWRDQDRATDVLSLECERPGDPDLAPGEPCELGRRGRPGLCVCREWPGLCACREWPGLCACREWPGPRDREGGLSRDYCDNA